MKRAVPSRVRAQALAWLALTLPVLVLALGLVADGAVLFATHRRALLLADGAARAGASQVDVAALRARPGGPPLLDPTAAQTVAVASVLRHEPGATVEAHATADAVLVRVRLTAPALLLHPPGADGPQVVAEALAEPFRGVETPRH